MKSGGFDFVRALAHLSIGCEGECTQSIGRNLDISHAIAREARQRTRWRSLLALDNERCWSRDARRGLREQNVFENVLPREIPALRLAGSSGYDGYCRLGVIHPVHVRAACAAVMVDVQHINAAAAD